MFLPDQCKKKCSWLWSQKITLKGHTCLIACHSERLNRVLNNTGIVDITVPRMYRLHFLGLLSFEALYRFTKSETGQVFCWHRTFVIFFIYWMFGGNFQDHNKNNRLNWNSIHDYVKVDLESHKIFVVIFSLKVCVKHFWAWSFNIRGMQMSWLLDPKLQIYKFKINYFWLYCVGEKQYISIQTF